MTANVWDLCVQTQMKLKHSLLKASISSFCGLNWTDWQDQKSPGGALFSCVSCSGWTVWSRSPSLMSRVRCRTKGSSLGRCVTLSSFAPFLSYAHSCRMTGEPETEWSQCGSFGNVFEVAGNNERWVGEISGGRGVCVCVCVLALSSRPKTVLH